MTLAMVFSLTACKTTDSQPGGDDSKKPVGNETSQPSDNDTNQPDDSETTKPDDSETTKPDDSETTKPDDSESNILDGSLEDILNKIYETADVDDNFKEYIKSGLQNEEVNSERIQYFLGKADIEFDSALASEPIMQPGAYSLVLVRVKEGTDVEQIKKDIMDNVDPMKWVCVGVQEENIIVDSIGDIVFLVMSDDQAKPLHEAFVALEK